MAEKLRDILAARSTSDLPRVFHLNPALDTSLLEKRTPFVGTSALGIRFHIDSCDYGDVRKQVPAFLTVVDIGVCQERLSYRDTQLVSIRLHEHVG